MKYRTYIKGIAVDCADEESLLRLIDRVTKHKPVDRPPMRSNRHHDSERVMKLLHHVQRAGRRGSGHRELAPLVKVKGAKGLGGFMGTVNRALTAAGFDPQDVLQKRTTADGNRLFPMAKIGDAIAELNQQLAVAQHHEEARSL